MIRIECTNPHCSSPQGNFEWDESRDLRQSGGLAEPGVYGANRLIVECPFCGTENLVWVKGLKHVDKLYRLKKSGSIRPLDEEA